MPSTYNFDLVGSRSGRWDSNYSRTSTQRWVCVTDNGSADPATIKAAFLANEGIGLWYEFTDGESAKCYVVGIDAAERADSEAPNAVWDITVSYSNQIDQGGGGGGGGITPVNASPASSIAEQQQGVLPADRIANPLVRPWTIKYSTQMVKMTLPYDANGKYYTNTLGDPYENIGEFEVPMMVYKIGVNYANYTYYNALFDHVGKTNDDTVVLRGKTWPRYSLRFLSVDNVEPICENEITYDRFEFTLVGWGNPVWNATLFTPAYEYWGHRIRRPNMGRREKVAGVLKPIIDDITKQPVSEPVFLTSAGLQVVTTTSGWEALVGWQTFQPHFEFDFGLF